MFRMNPKNLDMYNATTMFRLWCDSGGCVEQQNRPALLSGNLKGIRTQVMVIVLAWGRVRNRKFTPGKRP